MARFDTGRPCLELLTTAHPAERLDSADALRAWIGGSSLVPPGTLLDHVDHAWLPGFRDLRAQTARLVHDRLTAGARPYAPALARVNGLARAAPPAPRALLTEGGDLVRELTAPPECAAVLGALARDAVELLTDPVARACLRQCEGDDCPVVYLDTSRGRRRRWCSSEICGNRERVARHRRRAAAPAGT